MDDGVSDNATLWDEGCNSITSLPSLDESTKTKRSDASSANDQVIVNNSLIVADQRRECDEEIGNDERDMHNQQSGGQYISTITPSHIMNDDEDSLSKVVESGMSKQCSYEDGNYTPILLTVTKHDILNNHVATPRQTRTKCNDTVSLFETCDTLLQQPAGTVTSALSAYLPPEDELNTGEQSNFCNGDVTRDKFEKPS